MSDAENNLTFGQNLLGAAGNYYVAGEGADAARAAGQLGFETTQNIADTASGMATFQPFTVTAGTGSKAELGATGGIDMTMSPAEQALQQQLLTSSANMFSNIQTDPALAQQEIYNQMRALQQPEEERQRQAMQERMLSQGRTGLSLSQYGGSTPEQLARAQAVEEAKLKANLAARTQVGAEQKQMADLATGMLGASYTPQEQALAALGYGIDASKVAQSGANTAAQIFGQVGQTGVESLLQGEKLASAYELAMQQQMVNSILGTGSGSTGGLLSELGVGEAETPDWLKDLGDKYLPTWLGGDGDTSGAMNDAASGIGYNDTSGIA